MPPAPENHAVQLLGTRAMSQRQKMKPYPPLKTMTFKLRR